ncbi:MAG: CRTAC1 family protein [Ilumatobacter sp.]|nr:CRTAC1 family protein [Ilumatobacter sp.]
MATRRLDGLDPWSRRRRTALAGAAVLVIAACAGDDGGGADRAADTSPPVSVAQSGDGAASTDPQVPLPELGTPAGWRDPAGSTVLFRDVTEEAGVDVRFDSALEVELTKDTAIMMGGAGVGDFDRDGDSDLFVLGGGNERDSLFLNDGTGVFTDVTESAGLAELHLGAGVAVGDYDGDGWLDLFLTSHGTPDGGATTGAHRLYRNNGDLTFTDVAAEAGVATSSTVVHDGLGAVFGDVDLDGDLDLFIAGWQRDSLGNRLFENHGDGTFSDITEAAGIVDEIGIRGFSPCLVDTTGDRYPELLLVADFGTSRYYANAGAIVDGQPRFTDVTETAKVGQEWSGMGTAVGDVNNDGRLDWYATAIFDADDVGRGLGNKLYINQGDNLFDEVAATAGVDDGDWGWGAAMVDVNHDGWLDLIETNGWDLPSYVGNLSRMWIARGDGGFTDIAEDAGPLHNLHGLGVVEFDMDADGDRDIAITASNDEFTLYRNELAGSTTNWLTVDLDTGGSPGLAPDGIGAIVRARVGDQQFTRPIGGCANFNTSSELSAHFGVADATVIDELVVEWPNGEVTTMQDVAANQQVTITPS